ncbi:hypothetical protein KKH36_02140 [Patescibacteria group bacterium]|nr:hypothetical protein [Patescibacteria group bacterium]
MEMTPGEFFSELVNCKADYILENRNIIELDTVFIIMKNVTNLCDIILESKRRGFFEEKDYQYLSKQITKKLEELVDNAHLFSNDRQKIYINLQKNLDTWIRQRDMLSKEAQ